MLREAIPFVLVPAALTVIFAWFFWPVAIIFAALTAFMLFFFRNPHRAVPTGDGLVVSAADGTVTRIESSDEHQLVSVFLSPFNVHINRSPIAGNIRQVSYTPGKKIPATSDRASLVNERNSLVIENNEMTVTCTQIAGILARRIVCWAQEGDNLQRGERFGLIKFGSRTDLVMPASAKIAVKVGDRVKGGETIIAQLVTNE